MGLLGYPANAVVALSHGVLRFRYCTLPFARRFPWDLGTCGGFGQLSHILTIQNGGADEGHHSLPEEVNDRPKEVRRRFRGKTPVHQVVGVEVGPPTKRKKRLSLPGPCWGCQESSYFPRVGVGKSEIAAWSPGAGSRRHRHREPSQSVWLKRVYTGTPCFNKVQACIAPGTDTRACERRIKPTTTTFLEVALLPWIGHQSAAQAVPADRESGGCALCYGMSGRPSS